MVTNHHGPPLDTSPRVVVGVDGSEQSKLALRWAADVAGRFGVRLEIIGAWQLPPGIGWELLPSGWEWDLATPARKLLGEAVDEVFGSDRPAGMSVTLIEGDPAQVLLHHAKGATMLVVGSRGHSTLAGLLLGSVSARVARHATCPVLVVHGHEAPPAP